MVDLMDKDHMKICLTEMSTEVSNGFNEAVAKREQTQEHLKVKLEAIKSMMTRNGGCLKKLRSKIAKGTENKFLTPTDSPMSFCTVVKDMEKAVKEAKEEAEEADQLLNQVAAATEFSVLPYFYFTSFSSNF